MSNTAYDKLIAEDEEYIVYEMNMIHKGLYADGVIAINKDLAVREKTCILAEELGHHFTSYGDILDQSKHENEKQELRARAWAFEKLLPIDRFVTAFEHGCLNRFEIADFLEVTEEFIAESVEYYKRKYGTFALTTSGHVVYFDPLGVMKRIDNQSQQGAINVRI